MSENNAKIELLKSYNGSEIKLMEVCGTHTSAIFKSGIRSFLSPRIKLISGPGCPVCVTPTSYIDACISLSHKEDYQILSFGDMLKVPGSKMGTSLSNAIGSGGNVRMIYSPFEAIGLAKENPSNTYVVAAVGFETTAPAYALLLEEILMEGINNIKFLSGLKLTIPAIEWICLNEEDIDGFLCPGHVSVITGSEAYAPLADKYKKQFVIAGFEANHLVNALSLLVKNIGEIKKSEVVNLYEETVSPQGNIKAQNVISKYYDKCDAIWRGIGLLSNSGLKLKEEYSEYEIDSSSYTYSEDEEKMPDGCMCSDVIIGRMNPDECPSFGEKCKPGNPYGPCMVSTEGACGIWYRNIR